MKRINCFLALVCLLLMASCQKPEGTLPGSWMSSGDSGPVRCSVNGNLDYAVYDVTINLEGTTIDQLQLNKLDLHYFMTGQGQEKSLTILSDTVLRKNFRKTDTIWGLTPNSSYQYSMLIADFFNEKMSDTLSFHTLPVNIPSVTLDTAVMMNNLVWCYGTLQYHWRAPVPAESIYPVFMSTKDNDNVAISDVEIIQHQRHGDSVTDNFRFSHDLGNETMGGFAARVVNSWNVEAWSDTLFFTLFEISVETGDPQPIGAQHVWAYGTPHKDSEGVSINKLGFCLAKHYHPTIADLVYDASPGMMVWETPYNIRISDLEPNTDYFIRAYMQINSDSGPIFYGNERAFRTWTDVRVTMVEPDPLQVTSTSAFLDASLGNLGNFALHEESMEYGFIWKERDPDNPFNQELSFEDNQYLDYQPCNNLSEGRFTTMVTSLLSEKKYLVRAYVRFGEVNECFYSNICRLDTPR